jgi:hypothetical protein
MPDERIPDDPNARSAWWPPESKPEPTTVPEEKLPPSIRKMLSKKVTPPEE